MKITLFAAYTDGQDGSFSIRIYNTRQEALDKLGKTEEDLEEGNIYDDGAVEELNLEGHIEGDEFILDKPAYFSVG